MWNVHLEINQMIYTIRGAWRIRKRKKHFKLYITFEIGIIDYLVIIRHYWNAIPYKYILFALQAIIFQFIST